MFDQVEQLLASQEAMAAQYRAEARTIAERSEALVQVLRHTGCTD